eukprot:m.100657 g.100657  ORF g.100657 m.100657 type:complete len:676 (+) comp27264_c0_seq1:166-2193(+)
MDSTRSFRSTPPPPFVLDTEEPSRDRSTSIPVPMSPANYDDADDQNPLFEGTSPLPQLRHRTAFVTSDAMLNHYSLVGDHPECPDRISRIVQVIQTRGYLEKTLSLPAREATDEEIGAVHTVKHIEYVKSLSAMDNQTLKKEGGKWDSVYFNQATERSARIATGSLCTATEAVCTGLTTNAVAVIRPPGHHAEPGCCMGFCIYNNVAVAVERAKKGGAKRVLIVDWDVHHGNGTQNMFKSDPDVLFFSIHRWNNGNFYPGGNNGAPTTIGEGAGKGYSVNIGWNQMRMGDEEYLLAFRQVLMPIATEFDPDIVFISAGFDAARGDPLGGCMITPEGYAHLTHMLCGLASGRVIIALEGGYNLTSISESMAACVGVLVGDAPPRFDEPLGAANPKAVDDISDTINAHLDYWRSLVPLRSPKDERREKSGNKKGDPVLSARVSTMSLTSENDDEKVFVFSPPVTRNRKKNSVGKDDSRTHIQSQPQPLHQSQQQQQQQSRSQPPPGPQSQSQPLSKSQTRSQPHSRSQSQNASNETTPDVVQLILDAEYAAFLAGEWYNLRSPYAKHFLMIPLAAVQTDEMSWTVRYKVQPDTGQVYDREFNFRPRSPESFDHGWKCISMSSREPDVSAPLDLINIESEHKPRREISAEMLDWLPTTPIQVAPNRVHSFNTTDDDSS